MMKEAAIESKKGGEKGVTARSVRKVTAVRMAMNDSPLTHAYTSIGYARQVQGMRYSIH